MEDYYKKTCKFLKGFIRTKGITVFSKLSVKEYNVLAKENKLLNTYSINYISGLSWRNFKNYLIKEYKTEETAFKLFIKQVKRIIKQNNKED